MSQGTLNRIYLIHPKKKRWIQPFIHMAAHDLQRLNPAFQLPFVGRKIQKFRKKEEYQPWAGAMPSHAVHVYTEPCLPASASSAQAAGWGCACFRSHKATWAQHRVNTNKLRYEFSLGLGRCPPWAEQSHIGLEKTLFHATCLQSLAGKLWLKGFFLAMDGLFLCGFTKCRDRLGFALPRQRERWRDGTSRWSPSARSAWSASLSGCAPAASCPRCDVSSVFSWQTFLFLRFSTGPGVKQANAPVRSGAHPPPSCDSPTAWGPGDPTTLPWNTFSHPFSHQFPFVTNQISKYLAYR